MVTVVTTDTFSSIVSGTEIPVIIDFWAVWCGPCRSFSSVLDRVAEDYEGRILVGKVNVDEEPKLSEKFHVMSIPTLGVFVGGELRETLVGSRTYQDLVSLLELYLEG
jgi:thioredoxin 1